MRRRTPPKDIKPLRPRSPAPVLKKVSPPSVIINIPRTIPHLFSLPSVHPLPAKPLDTARSVSSPRISLEATRIQRKSPPPDPKSLAYISSSGSISNPLGIKPSSKPGHQRIVSHLQPSATSSSSTTQTKPKKPLGIGNGWPYARTNSSVNSSSGQSSRATVQAVEPKPLALRISTARAKSPLNSISAYATPSPTLQSNPSNGPKRKKKKKGKNKNQGVDRTVANSASNPIVKLGECLSLSPPSLILTKKFII